MAEEIVFRFLVGGAFVCLFSLSGDLLRPKSFAGLFAAAPSVALATLALTITKNGASYAATETRSMVGGAAAFVVYAICTSRATVKCGASAFTAATLFIPLWIAVAVLLWWAFLK